MKLSSKVFLVWKNATRWKCGSATRFKKILNLESCNRYIYILMIDKDLNRGDRDTTIVNRIPIASKCIGIRDRDRDYTIESRLKLQRGERERDVGRGVDKSGKT